MLVLPLLDPPALSEPPTPVAELPPDELAKLAFELEQAPNERAKQMSEQRYCMLEFMVILRDDGGVTSRSLKLVCRCNYDTIRATPWLPWRSSDQIAESLPSTPLR